MISDECYGLFQNVGVIYNHVSIEENTKANVSVYPNPAKDYIKLAISGQLSVVRIYNVLGMLVEEITVGTHLDTSATNSDEIEINISDYNPGIYFFNINGSVTKVLIK